MTPPTGRDRHDGHDGHDGSDRATAAGVDTPASAPERQIDPRAVRVVLAPAMGHIDLAALVVEPMPVPVAPIPSVIGVGILGGAATGPREEASPAGPASPAEVLVDGSPRSPSLAHLGHGRTILIAADPADPLAPPVRVILETPEIPADGRGVVRREVVVDGWRIDVEIGSERRASLRDRARRGREETAHGGPTEVHAIIPGRIVSVSVVPGEAVVAGQQLLVVEAMKMQNELRAPRDGTISRVGVAPGETIEIGDLLLVLE